MPDANIDTNLAEVKKIIGQGKQVKDNDHSVRITALSSLESADSQCLAFGTPRKKSQLGLTKAGVLILDTSIASQYTGPANVILHSNPTLAFTELLSHFYPEQQAQAGIHPSACCHPDATISNQASIGANTVVDAGAQIESGVTVAANCVIGKFVKIGKETKIYPNVTIYDRTTVGQRCIIHSGCVIGSDGFGYVPQQSMWKKINHLGCVMISSDVEIGANTCIDRGMLDNTEINQGTKIDNLVHIAHNVKIGKHCAIAGCVGIAGSTTIGNHVRMGGQASINGQITICDHAVVGGGTSITSSVKRPDLYIGIVPAQPQKNWARSALAFKKTGQIKTEKTHD